MFEGLNSLFDSSWIYALVAASVLLDVFVPVVPSGVLVVTAATAATTGASGDLADAGVLLLCAATASCLGDIAAYRVARRGSGRLNHRLTNSLRLATAQERIGQVLARGGGGLVVLARFAPAGRSVVSLSAGAAHRTIKEFLPWSALAGLVWAAYGVGLGYLGGRWSGAGWITTALPVAALAATGGFVTLIFRREHRQALILVTESH